MKNFTQLDAEALALFQDESIHAPETRETKPNGLIGLSLSFCIAAIASGNVQEEEVVQLITGTRVQSDEEWQEVIESYQKTYWREFPEEAAAICKRLLAQGKIKQSRVAVGDEKFFGHNISDGAWINAQDLDKWLAFQVDSGYITPEVREALGRVL